MISRSKCLARIHILRKELALPVDAYRAVLLREFGVTSARDLRDNDLPRAVQTLEDMQGKQPQKPLPPKSRAESFLWVVWYNELCPLLQPRQRTIPYMAAIIERRIGRKILDGNRLLTALLDPGELHQAIEALKNAAVQRKTTAAPPPPVQLNEFGNDIQNHPELSEVPF